ncbi:MAG: DUF924 family protein [Candidatus Berkiella sp.]
MIKKIMSLCAGALLVLAINAHANPTETELGIQKVLDNWFEYDHNHAPLFENTVWWVKNKEVDDTIRLQYKDLYQQAIQGGLKDWLATPRGTLAYVILIDQFSRNMFRDSPKAYQHDELALKVAKDAIQKGVDKQLTLTERVFLYLPLEHSENIDDQNQSVALFEQLYKDTPAAQKPLAAKFLKYAKAHQQIIAQFGRFPHRNKILSRKSTPEEQAFLKTHPGF